MTPPPRRARVTITRAPVGLPVDALVIRWDRTASLADGNYARRTSRLDVGRWCVIIIGGCASGSGRMGPGR